MSFSGDMVRDWLRSVGRAEGTFKRKEFDMVIDVPAEVVVWTFGGLAGNLRSENNYENNQGYSLHCETNGEYLIWEKDQLSVNLGFDSKPQTKVHFHLPDGTEREILSGELVAFGIGGGDAYLYYGQQRFGINLKWSKKPLYQWRILRADGQLDAPISVGTQCTLYNEKVDPDPDFLIHLEKHAPRVVDLGWTSSPDWIMDGLKGAARVAIEALVKAKTSG
jgi:hypothetical protein